MGYFERHCAHIKGETGSGEENRGGKSRFVGTYIFSIKYKQKYANPKATFSKMFF